MEQELARKRPANVAVPARTLVDMPRVIGTTIVRGKTERAVLRKVKRLSLRGYIGGASEIARFHSRAGGGYGVKVALIKPLPAPMPGWAKGCALVGSVLAGLSLLAVLVLNALASLFTAAAALPWGTIIGGAIVCALLLAFTRPGRACCRIIVEVWH